MPGSRRLSAGHRPANQQAPAGLIPGCQIGPVSMTVGCLSTEHPRFTFVRLPGPHLTSQARLFPVRSPPGISSPSSAGWFEGWSCNPPPEGRPPSSMQQGRFQSVITSTSFPRRHGTLWRSTTAIVANRSGEKNYRRHEERSTKLQISFLAVQSRVSPRLAIH